MLLCIGPIKVHLSPELVVLLDVLAVLENFGVNLVVAIVDRVPF